MRYIGRMLTFSFNEFIASGGMQAKEHAAAERAITEEREFWLPILEAAADTLTDEDDVQLHVLAAAEIRRLRRLPRLPPRPFSPEAIERRRQQTRERVRRYRQRQLQATE